MTTEADTVIESNPTVLAFYWRSVITDPPH